MEETGDFKKMVGQLHSYCPECKTKKGPGEIMIDKDRLLRCADCGHRFSTDESEP